MIFIFLNDEGGLFTGSGGKCLLSVERQSGKGRAGRDTGGSAAARELDGRG